jgi:hypothetical protein
VFIKAAFHRNRDLHTILYALVRAVETREHSATPIPAAFPITTWIRLTLQGPHTGSGFWLTTLQR